MMQRLLALDHRWTHALRLRPEQRTLWRLAAVFAHSGDSWFWGAGLLLVIWRGDAAQRAWAIGLLLAIAGLAAFVLVIKFLFRRQRPPGEWGSVYRLTDPHSFPSGHAARAFLIAALVVAWGPAWLVPIIVLWAPLVALARVAVGLHFLLDVVGGVLLGLVAAVVVVQVVA
jgi:undecaprenyl-diphosphatase